MTPAPNKKYITATVLLLCMVLVWRGTLLFSHSSLTLSVLSVTKGDAVLVDVSGGSRVLIDAGGDRSILRALGETLPPWVRSLDALIETAQVSGATGGERDVLGTYHVEKVVTQNDVHRGQRLDLGGGAYVDVLYPDRDVSKMDPADGALVLRVVYGQTSFLIKENISSRADEYVTSLTGGAADGEVVIASSTPPGTFVSDGVSIKKE